MILWSGRKSIATDVLNDIVNLPTEAFVLPGESVQLSQSMTGSVRCDASCVLSLCLSVCAV